jgi:hypothetical protein
MFNDYLREGVVVLSASAKDNKPMNIDMYWRNIFRQHIFQLELAAAYQPRYYILDF